MYMHVYLYMSIDCPKIFSPQPPPQTSSIHDTGAGIAPLCVFPAYFFSFSLPFSLFFHSARLHRANGITGLTERASVFPAATPRQRLRK